jgi:hypothetical protein
MHACCLPACRVCVRAEGPQPISRPTHTLSLSHTNTHTTPAYAVGPLDGSAAAMMAPMAHDLLPVPLGADDTALLNAAISGTALPPPAAAPTGKRGSGGGSKRGAGKGAGAKKTAAAASSSNSGSTSTLPMALSSGLPFADIEPGPVELAGGGGKGGKGKPTKRYTCCAPGCTQSATFKPADEPRSKHNMVCVKHACKGMSCIKGPLCDHPDCVHENISTVPRRATFGFPGERQRRCGKHKLAGMLYASAYGQLAGCIDRCIHV